MRVPPEPESQPGAQAEFLDMTTLVPSPGSIPPRFARSSRPPPALQYPLSPLQRVLEVTSVESLEPTDNARPSSPVEGVSSPALVPDTSEHAPEARMPRADVESNSTAADTGDKTQEPNNNTMDNTGNNPADVPNNAASATCSDGTGTMTTPLSDPTPRIPARRPVRAPLHREGAIIILSKQDNPESLAHLNVDPPTVLATGGTGISSVPASILPTVTNSKHETKPEAPANTSVVTPEAGNHLGKVASGEQSCKIEHEQEEREGGNEKNEEASKRTTKRTATGKGKGRGKEVVAENTEEEMGHGRPQPNTRAKSIVIAKEAVLEVIGDEKEERRGEQKLSGRGSKGKAKAEQSEEAGQELEEHAATNAKSKTWRQSRVTSAAMGKKRAREMEKVDEEVEKKDEDARPTRRLRSTRNKRV
ncbi:hypothetical protein AX16_006073 [Volvariella volvacea WC 439]|nr:hypothetical protein AX16_006073 [Volvariella volvacea WC 439]